MFYCSNIDKHSYVFNMTSVSKIPFNFLGFFKQNNAKQSNLGHLFLSWKNSKKIKIVDVHHYVDCRGWFYAYIAQQDFEIGDLKSFDHL